MICYYSPENYQSIPDPPVSAEISGKAYITKEDSYKDCVLYFLYTSSGRFVNLFWSESEARIKAAAMGFECEDKVRGPTLPRVLGGVSGYNIIY